MYHQAGGYQPYPAQVNHDEVSRQIYGGAPYPPSIYIEPSDPRHPHSLAQDSSPHYLPHPYPPVTHPSHVEPPPTAYSTSLNHISPYTNMLHSPLPDPAFSSDPRANPTNPYAHYTAYRMDSREEIAPIGPSHDVSSRFASRASSTQFSSKHIPSHFTMPISHTTHRIVLETLMLYRRARASSSVMSPPYMALQ